MSGRAPRRKVRRQWRWPELGTCGDGGYGTGTSRKGGGKRRSPHSGVVEQLGRLGEALFGANRRRGSMVADEEDDDAEGDAVRPGLLILSAQMRTTFSQQLDTGRGLGCTMATVLVIGGDGYVWSRSRKGLEGEGENRGSSERVGRTGTTPRRGFAASRCPRTQAGSLVAWRSRAGASTRLCLLAEVEDGGELGWASAALLGQVGR